MQYLGDYAEDGTVSYKFATHQLDGTPITFAGSPAVAVYKSNNTTEITTGVTLTEDFDSRTGCNHVQVDLSSSSDYATANDYQIVVTSGTVDGTSVVGQVLATFSIENRFLGVGYGGATLFPKLQAGTNGTTLVLDSDEPSSDDYYNNMIIELPDTATMALVSDYTGSTQTATVVDLRTGAAISPAPSSGERYIPVSYTVSDLRQIEGSSTDVTKFKAMLKAALYGSVSSGTNSTTFTSDLTGYGDNYFNDSFIVFTSGNLIGEAQDISDYTSATGEFVVGSAFTQTPSASETFIVVGKVA